MRADMLDDPIVKGSGEANFEEDNFVKEVLKDYRICCISREVSLTGRKEVLTGKAKFGILGDGKEVPQVALARTFRKGDWRSGYYRDQTIMFALGICTVEEFFAQLYADSENDPFSGGRQMNNHFATPTVDADGNWRNHTQSYNISSDISCTGGQMARGLGLAFASRLYRANPTLSKGSLFSQEGNEVCFITIGDASTSEGVFWETVNAAGVLQVPLAISVWDDDYGISVPKKYQTTKQSISEVLEGFRVNEEGEGIEIYKVKGWDYPALCEAYEKGIERMRENHTAALFHITELTQPQGHSTSGSHERYKSKERLEWEREHDCIKVMRQWIIDSGIATEEEVDEIGREAREHVKEARKRAWNAYMQPLREEVQLVKQLYDQLIAAFPQNDQVLEVKKELESLIDPLYTEMVQNARRMLFSLKGVQHETQQQLADWIRKAKNTGKQRYNTYLYSESPRSALKVPVLPAQYSEDAPMKNGFQILNACFDKNLDNNLNIFAFGEDVGQIGDVNQGFAGLQAKYGEGRVFDTGIREWTIVGQAIGMAMRGLRPIAEIQYLDYLVYGLEPLTDDLATLRYRSNNLQQAPVIIRTRGHRLEGIWHAGSPMGMLINSLRGLYLCVPRNMTQAAGMYNTLLLSDDPAVVIECLNGYRLKERLPNNIGEFTVPLGVPEVLQSGKDLTIVTYGSCVRVAQAGIKLLEAHGISVELIDVQTLLPFDLEHHIAASLQKTNRVLFVDEDVPGGATAYMVQEVIEGQHAYQYLDSAPQTLTAKPHRPPYGSDGDYFTKPNPEDVFEAAYAIMREAEPGRFADLGF
ncbi:MAG: thiamine pyrophosphate-dependent enzyme [Bacteroidota bacterium]